ncbi:hypothetical protein SNE40_013133 [Patella caerulea]|uniref:Uncharacterized protein n=1 Tax=Patella caerulea TaxID=87958 RepID=A0AAN8PKP8_PATCE
MFLQSTDINRADQGTRTMHARKINNSPWLLRPSEFLTNNDSRSLDCFELVDPNEDPEIRPDTSVTVLKTRINGTSTNSDQLGTDRYSKFSCWKSLVRVVSLIKARIRRVNNSVDIHEDAETFIVKSVQCEVYEEEIHNLKHNRPLQRTSKILFLNPYLDKDGVLRVGGRLNNIAETFSEKNPILIPGRHYISTSKKLS